MDKKEILVIVLIGVLLITVALQTTQLVGLRKSEIVMPAHTAAAPAASSGGSAPAVPANLQNLPTMVGGC